MTENKNILEVHHLKKASPPVKILHGCRRHKLFSENGEVLGIVGNPAQEKALWRR